MLSLAIALTLLSGEAPRLLNAAPASSASVARTIAAVFDVFQRPSRPPSYAAEPRAVTNWRHEAAHALDPVPLSALAAVFDLDRPVVTRCVRLNNYWCIKSARWNGEIGADEEGHTGFANAEHGADAAVTLLRRYYLEFGRKSALDIVRRWAPAECRASVGRTASPTVFAVRGLGNTLRARWLAANRRPLVRRARIAAAGGASPAPSRASGSKPPQARPSRAPAARVSAVPSRPLPTFRMPTIATGIGERSAVSISATLAPRAAVRRQPTPASVAAAQRAMKVRAAAQPVRPTLARSASAQPIRTAAVMPAAAVQRPSTSTATDAGPAPAWSAFRPVFACGSDEQRIQNYAGRIVQGLGLGPNDDLRLFEENGRPLPNLPRVMLAMSWFELGVLRASAGLVDGAVARAALRAQAAPANAGALGENSTPPI